MILSDWWTVHSSTISSDAMMKITFFLLRALAFSCIIYKILYWYARIRKSNILCKHVRILLIHNPSQSDSLGRLRWSSHLTSAQLLNRDWEKQREWSWSKPWCLSQGWKLWMFLRHFAKSCKLLHITLQPHRLKKETGLPPTPLKEKTCSLPFQMKHLPFLSPVPSSLLPLLCLKTGPWACLWYFPSLFKKRKRVKLLSHVSQWAWLTCEGLYSLVLYIVFYGRKISGNHL